ncbi:MAG: nucleotidyltransferase domain-containing protein [bacterium]
MEKVDYRREIPDSPYKSLIVKFADVLRRKWGDRLVSVVLYGSMARGDFHSFSDIDLIIVAEGLPPTFFARLDSLREVEDELRSEIEDLRSKGHHPSFSKVIKTPEEAAHHSPLYLDMTLDAIILYDKCDFFLRVLEGMRENMRRLGSRRVRVGDSWYWDLKPDYKYGEVFEI